MMKSTILSLCLCVLVFSVSSDDCPTRPEVVCYWGSWSQYRPDIGQFSVENIDISLCTRIIYAFVGLDKNLDINSLDEWADVTTGGLKNFTGLKEKNPCLKTTLAIGGWNEGSLKYSVVAASEDRRQRFANGVLNYLAYYGFDGFDLDWEYPAARGGIPEDKNNYPLLLKVIKKTIAPWNLTLSTAVPFDVDVIESGYDIQAIAEAVDFVHLMAYDHVSAHSKKTGLSSPLSLVQTSVSKWINGGLPPSKLILGLQAYARIFALEDPSRHEVGDPVIGPGEPGFYTMEAGFLAYYEVLDVIDIGMKQVQTDGTNYAYSTHEWMTFENEETIRLKTRYALDQNLSGIMLWSIDTDDFLGTFGKKYPLLSAANDAISMYYNGNT